MHSIIIVPIIPPTFYNYCGPVEDGLPWWSAIIIVSVATALTFVGVQVLKAIIRSVK